MSAWEFLFNIIVALVMGMAIGLERQQRQHTAGLRTNALVALGAAMFVSLTRLMGDESSPTRIASYIVSGLGFLGGGVILRDGLNVKGLNTAATIWCTGAVGTLAGSSFPIEAILGTLAVLGANVGLRPLVERIDARRRVATDVETYYRIQVTCRSAQEAVVRMVLLRHISGNPSTSVQGIATTDDEEKGQSVVTADVYASHRVDRFLEELVGRISIEPNVTAVSWQKAPG